MCVIYDHLPLIAHAFFPYMIRGGSTEQVMFELRELLLKMVLEITVEERSNVVYTLGSKSRRNVFKTIT